MVETHCSLMIHQFLIIDQNIFPRNLPDCTVLSNWFFDNFILAAKLSGKFYEELQLVYPLVITYVEN